MQVYESRLITQNLRGENTQNDHFLKKIQKGNSHV